VHILDPFVGTGNFIVRIMQEIKTSALPTKYENELHCNEVMLLPYYIASMNIEREYYERTKEYKSFPGICLVDTFELAEAGQSSFGFMTAENAERVKRQKESPIFVIVGNPPYNSGQVNENDNNKNRKYKVIDSRVSETYGKLSKAKLLRKLQDPYVKAIRWASDRLGGQGIACLVTNNGFIDNIAFDGMRESLSKDFDALYILDLRGRIRKDSMLDGIPLGEEHTVFGLAAMVGVSIALFVRNNGTKHGIFYAACDFRSTRVEKFNLLEQWSTYSGVPWKKITPDLDQNWLTEGMSSEFDKFPAMGGDKELFSFHLLGLSTNRDETAIAFTSANLKEKVEAFCRDYNIEVFRWQNEERENFSDLIKWSETLKLKLKRGKLIKFSPSKIQSLLYRPFTTEFVYYDDVVLDRPSHFRRIFSQAPSDNVVVCLTGPGSDKPFLALAACSLVDLHVVGAGCGTQCFPFYTYAEDGTHRRENITDWALEQFRSHYSDPSISKWDIFHYVYAVLHHPEYRERYAANLRRELPRVPFVALTPCHPEAAESSAARTAPNEGPMQLAGESGAAGESMGPSARKGRGPQDDKLVSARDVFRAFVRAGERLADIHVHYEQQLEYPLTKTEKAGERLDYRVEKLKLSKDKATLIYNRFLTLSGIPPETYEYRLGNRSALEWIVDQYQVSTDKRSGIVNDPNREDDPEYILRLIGQVVTVSLETVRIVKALPPLGVETEKAELENGFIRIKPAL
jgi:predicted helicase